MSTEKKLTAVEWLEKELLYYVDTDYAKDIIQQAKEKEKQQIIRAGNWGSLYSDSNKTIEQYYKETYKK